VRTFYKLVDEFHRMWDVVTEFDSLSHLATQMVPVSGRAQRSTVSQQCGSKGGALRTMVLRLSMVLLAAVQVHELQM
jgi:hypothetical protein